jgi:SsrA-binding protein
MRKINRRAKYDYQILEKFEAGIVLSGAEVKAIKQGNIDLNLSYAKIIGQEVFLINANIPVTGKIGYSPTRTRKLLLKKNEIISLQTKIKAKKLTLIPYSVYTKGRLIKLKLALAKPKRKFEKKETIKRKDIEREIERELKKI